MNMSISRKAATLTFVILAFAKIASAAAAAPDDPLCYYNPKIYKDGLYISDKPIHIDIQKSNPLPAGAQFTIDVTRSAVPSGQMSTPAPVMHPDFKLISSTAHTFTYTVPDRSGDFQGNVTIIDTYCGFRESISITLPVRK